MTGTYWLQFIAFFGVLFLITKPLGLYLFRVLDSNGKTFLDPILKPIELGTYQVLGIDHKKEQGWKDYTLSLLVMSMVSLLFTYLILRTQYYLPLNPENFPNITPDLAFNIAASFTTNTNWQSYVPEVTLSYFSQMVGLVLHNFLSAAAGMAVAAALVRGIARYTAQTIGNFWVDIVRILYYLLLPMSLIGAIFLMSQGVIQNFKPYIATQALEAKRSQLLPQGPVASQEAIKLLGTNGGGFFNANSAHPYENPNALTNFFQILSMLALSSAFTYYLGRMVKNQKHGWAVWSAMAIIFFIGFFALAHFERVGNPIHQSLGIDRMDGNMEGKEVRFGIFNSVLFANSTTNTSGGAVNSAHDSYTPLGGMVMLVNMQLGEIIFGGVGSGLYGMIIYVILAVFIAGLMIGRAPEYFGQKIDTYDVKVSMLALLVAVISILGFSALAAINPVGLQNAGPHGLSEILYAFSSATGNNGSAFAGLSANTFFYNVTLGVAMLFGRFFVIIPILALAGSLARKRHVPVGPGSFPVSGPLFTILLMGVITLVGALTFFPVLMLGPIVEHFLMRAGVIF